ncbi:uncharacterized protein DDB_G0271670-like [Xenia sp. Carnegie-2017]|uniref:uncharacterized protein DDB_G0271670-like n=1 Tax=Xenia sp. Carnegie-2017 TaxID=2897299 RepID=UPI001F03742C|nr:uncharacterized protein DDB_G0271670-like [Xenia sp. Carnegie-2017]
MVLPLLNGVLPSPTTPKKISSNPNDFIGKSYYPLPFQASSLIENLGIGSSPSWDININNKSIKLKIEWYVEKNNINSHEFPKPLLNTLSSYNLVQPTWSSSFADEKLSFKFEWRQLSDDTNSPEQVKTPPTKASFHTPDSGYASTSKSYVYPSPNLVTPTKLFHNHPLSSLNPLTPPYTPYKHVNFPHKGSNTPSTQTKSNNKCVPRSKHHTLSSTYIKNNNSTSHTHKPPKTPSKPSTISPTSAQTTKPQSTVTCSVIFNDCQQSNTNSNTSTSISKPTTTSKKKSTINSTTNTLPPNKTSITTTTSSNNSPKPSSSTSSFNTTTPTPHKSIAQPSSIHNQPSPGIEGDENFSANGMPWHLLDLHQDEDHIGIIPSSPLIGISEKSTEDNIITTINDSPPEFDLGEEKYLETPSPLITTTNGLLDNNLQVERMDIKGTCRLCKQEVKSHEIDYHLLFCPHTEEKLDAICSKYSKLSKNNATMNGIYCIIHDYIECCIVDEEISNCFSLSTFKNFVKDIDHYLNEHAITIFK